MDTLQNIRERISVRQFSDSPVTDEAVHAILEAAMSGPTAKNMRPWSFIVVRDPAMLNAMAEANGPQADPLKGAQVGILVCGDLERSISREWDYWVIDGAIAAQNMVLAANAMGIGSVWLGTWPRENRVAAQAALFNLPETQVPHSIIAFGYPAAPSDKVKCLYEEDRVHFEKW